MTYSGTLWQAQAACSEASAGYFYPPDHAERRPEREKREGAARAICGRCRVRAECLGYALAVGEAHGIWGGLDEIQRRRPAHRERAQR